MHLSSRQISPYVAPTVRELLPLPPGALRAKIWVSET